LAQPIVTPNNALVTGYDFLKDEATAIKKSFADQGVTDTLGPINDNWTAADFRASFFAPTAHNRNSLNSHFAHNRFFPNDNNNVYATEITSTTDYQGSLVFSVGCHSGLNVPDADFPSTQLGTDWPQAFLRKGAATFIGNTGFGYGDSDLISYSERVMANFAEELGNEGAAIPSVGSAMLNAKQRYFDSIGAASLSNYDEKVMG